MTKKDKPYKPTQNIVVNDVPKVYAKLYNKLNRITEDELSGSELFNQMVMAYAVEYFGKEYAEKVFKRLEDREALLARADL